MLEGTRECTGKQIRVYMPRCNLWIPRLVLFISLVYFARCLTFIIPFFHTTRHAEDLNSSIANTKVFVLLSGKRAMRLFFVFTRALSPLFPNIP